MIAYRVCNGSYESLRKTTGVIRELRMCRILLRTGVLEESDVIVGTTSSTFSFSAHARGLAVPYYPSFRSDRSDACEAVTGTEGGLLFRVTESMVRLSINAPETGNVGRCIVNL